MRLPRWLARFNKRVTNRILIRLVDRPPYCAIRHVGRVTGRGYRTPLTVFRSGDRFVFALTYGPGADWVQNVIMSGSATLEYGGDLLALREPRLVDRAAAWPALPRLARLGLIALRTRDFLEMNVESADTGRNRP